MGSEGKCNIAFFLSAFRTLYLSLYRIRALICIRAGSGASASRQQTHTHGKAYYHRFSLFHYNTLLDFSADSCNIILRFLTSRIVPGRSFTYLYRIIFDRFRTCTEAVWLWIFLPPQWEDYEKEKHSAKQII